MKKQVNIYSLEENYCGAKSKILLFIVCFSTFLVLYGSVTHNNKMLSQNTNHILFQFLFKPVTLNIWGTICKSIGQ